MKNYLVIYKDQDGKFYIHHAKDVMTMSEAEYEIICQNTSKEFRENDKFFTVVQITLIS